MNGYINNQNLYISIGGISLIILLGSFGERNKVYNILPLPLEYIPEQFHKVILPIESSINIKKRSFGKNKFLIWNQKKRKKIKIK